jgi:predicted Zn-dependent peptidase
MSVSVSPERATEAKNELINIFQTFVTGGATETEFMRARNYINMRTLMSFDSPYSIAREMASDIFWDNEVQMPDEYVAIVNEITLEEINTSFNELREAKLVTSVMSRNLDSI